MLEINKLEKGGSPYQSIVLGGGCLKAIGAQKLYDVSKSLISLSFSFLMAESLEILGRKKSLTV